MKDYSMFFESIEQGLVEAIGPSLWEQRLFFDADGAIIDIIRSRKDSAETRDYIVITDDEFDACNQKRTDYRVTLDNKLEFSPPKQKLWGLEQEELSRNPYTCKQ